MFGMLTGSRRLESLQNLGDFLGVSLPSSPWEPPGLTNLPVLTSLSSRRDPSGRRRPSRLDPSQDDLENLHLSRISGPRELLGHRDVSASPSQKHPLRLTSLSGRENLPQLGLLRSRRLLRLEPPRGRGGSDLPRLLNLGDLLGLSDLVGLLSLSRRSGRGSLLRRHLTQFLGLSLPWSLGDLLLLPGLAHTPGLLTNLPSLRRPSSLPGLPSSRPLFNHRHPSRLVLLPAQGCLPSFEVPPNLMGLSSPELLLLTLIGQLVWKDPTPRRQ